MQWSSGQLAPLSSLGEVQAGETHLESGMCPTFPGSGTGKGRKPSILVSQGCHYKILQSGWLVQQVCILTDLEARSPRSHLG